MKVSFETRKVTEDATPATHAHIYVYIYIYTHMCVYIYIYIYIGRERERERERERCIYTHIAQTVFDDRAEPG